MTRIFRTTAAFIFIFASTAVTALELGAPFRNHAILQQKMPVPVWGWSNPGTEVTVQFNGQKVSVKADAKGAWNATLEPLNASFDPSKLIVSEKGGDSVTLEDILVGEVWVASGQSNMQWTASKCDVGRVLQSRIKERVEKGEEKNPVIREALITDYFSAPQPIRHANAEWRTKQSEFSAVAFAFAYDLHKELKVPIGILNCSFSQTAIQAWTPRSGFEATAEKSEYTKNIYQKVLASDPRTPEHKKSWDEYFGSVEQVLADNKKKSSEGAADYLMKPIPNKVPGIYNNNRDATWLYNARFHPMIPYAISGVIWNQGYANMGEGITYYDNLHSMITGWRANWKNPNLPVYFNQFYCPGQKGDWNHNPTIGGAADMRAGTAMARDIPNTGMASQIDISGSIHYFNKALAGKRLALHALKNEYGKKVEADGPFFKKYTVSGNKLIVEFSNADKLLVGETKTNSKENLGLPKVIENGASQLKAFYLAGADKVWHPATAKIDGNKVTLTSASVSKPQGVSYGSGGIGNEANLYNSALLPATPFIYYDNKLVTAATWEVEKLKVAGVEIDPNTVGLIYEWRKMPILSTQFRDNAIFQADQPVKIWGSCLHDWGKPAEGKGVIHFSFAGIKKDIPITPEMKEWYVTVPAMPASTDPKTLKVSFTIDGELAHERVAENILIGDVWYVAAPPGEGSKKKDSEKAADEGIGLVRMMTRKSKRDRKNNPSRYSVATSRTPKNRFASEWTQASGFPAELGKALHNKTKRPIGIIYMQTAKQGKPSIDITKLDHWINAKALKHSPSLKDDHLQLASLVPGTPEYADNARRYVAAWKTFFSDYVSKIIDSGAIPDKAPWGKYPVLAGEVTTKAAEVHNVLVESFSDTALKGKIFISSDKMAERELNARFSEQLSALASGWQSHLSLNETPFFFTYPSSVKSPQIKSKGKNIGVKVDNASDSSNLDSLIQEIIKNSP